GGKNRRRGKNENESEKRELIFKEDGQEYAQVVKMLGNGRLEAQCFDGEKRLAHIRGKLRKKVWINQGDIILISLRDYQDAKADVILKYTTEEARNLKAYGELPETAKINETDTFGPEDEECNFEFDIDEKKTKALKYFCHCFLILCWMLKVTSEDYLVFSSGNHLDSVISKVHIIETTI
ncbi:8473_t:CDS:2, partial [Cetraspora pellucida]